VTSAVLVGPTVEELPATAPGVVDEVVSGTIDEEGETSPVVVVEPSVVVVEPSVVVVEPSVVVVEPSVVVVEPSVVVVEPSVVVVEPSVVVGVSPASQQKVMWLISWGEARPVPDVASVGGS
jgi:hypothetical protein